MGVSFGFVLIIVGAVLAFKGHVFLTLVCVMIGVYPISIAITHDIRNALSKSERGRRILDEADRERRRKEHHIKR